MRGLAILLVLVPLGCTPGSPEGGKPAKSVEPPAAKPSTDPPNPIEPPTDPCGQQIADYLASRDKLSHCESDSDCSEMWPGLCPHGPYYIHRDADIDPILALERQIMAECRIPDCEPPMELGIAHCEAGRCAKGRAPAKRKKRDEVSCWDYRETWLEADGSASATTFQMLQGITPHIAIAPASKGVLVLEIDWPADCSDCQLMISEHNSGMAQLITPESSRTQAERNGVPVSRERLEFPVRPGPYHMLALRENPVDYVIRADLRDAAGERGRVTRHGVVWQRMCEG